MRQMALVLDDGTVITESIAICRYFEELHPEPALFGRGAIGRAMVEMWNRRAELGRRAVLRAAELPGWMQPPALQLKIQIPAFEVPRRPEPRRSAYQISSRFQTSRVGSYGRPWWESPSMTFVIFLDRKP